MRAGYNLQNDVPAFDITTRLAGPHLFYVMNFAKG